MWLKIPLRGSKPHCVAPKPHECTPNPIAPFGPPWGAPGSATWAGGWIISSSPRDSGRRCATPRSAPRPWEATTAPSRSTWPYRALEGAIPAKIPLAGPKIPLRRPKIPLRRPKIPLRGSKSHYVDPKSHYVAMGSDHCPITLYLAL